MIKLDASETSVLPVRLARVLERDIVVGRLVPGARITEDAVLERVEVSRSPVREAFRILEQDGLLVRGERRGMKVAPLSIADLDEIYDVRVFLEGRVTRAAALQALPSDIQSLEKHLATLLEITDETSPELYLDANTAFSQSLYTASHNPTLTRLASSLSKQALRYRFIAYSRVAGFTAESQVGACQVLAAIKAGNFDLASKTQADLVRSSWQQVRTLLVTAGIEAPPQIIQETGDSA